MSRLRARLSSEGGFTLIELLVVVLLVGVVGSVVATGVIRGMQTSRTAQERIHALTDLEAATHRVTRELRAADPLWGDPEPGAITATAYRDDTRWQYTYRVADGGSELVEERIEYADELSATIASEATSVVADGLAQDALTTFRFWDDEGAELDPGEGIGVGEVREVSVTLGAELSTGEVIRVETSATVRNSAAGG